jgi:hypothetical protein
VVGGHQDVLLVRVAKTRRKRSVTAKKVLQEWTVEVVSVDRKLGDFVGIMTDRTNPGNPDERAAFSMEMIDKKARKEIRPGSILRWTVTRDGGTMTCSMRRWTRRDLRRLLERAKALRAPLRLENEKGKGGER